VEHTQKDKIQWQITGHYLWHFNFHHVALLSILHQKGLSSGYNVVSRVTVPSHFLRKHLLFGFFSYISPCYLALGIALMAPHHLVVLQDAHRMH
jgi:hypothetical protein